MQSPEVPSNLAPPQPDEAPAVLLLIGDAAAHRSQVAAAAEEVGVRTPTFECSACGYGVARWTPPERCPMSHNGGTWLYRSRQPFSDA
jgi:hypothetical protein